MVAQAGLIRSLIRYGTEVQIERFLPRLMSGAIGATALTETRGWIRRRADETIAHATDDGYVLKGIKDHITHGPITDITLVLGRVPALGARDISLFLVDTDLPGVRRGAPEDMLGNRTSPTGPIQFDHVALDRHALFGQAGHGLELIYDTISLDRLLYGVASAAFLEPVLDEAMDFAAQRVAFKKPIAANQYVQGRLTDIRFGIETARWTSYAALDAVLENRPEASMLCSIAKYQGSEQLLAGTQNAIRLLGHVGYMTGPAARRFLDGLGTIIAGGTSEMQRKNVFNQMVGPAGTSCCSPRLRTGRLDHGAGGVSTLAGEVRPSFDVGVTGRLVRPVEDSHLATAWENDLPVLSTPILLWWAELAAMDAVAGAIQPTLDDCRGPPRRHPPGADPGASRSRSLLDWSPPTADFSRSRCRLTTAPARS